MLNSMRVQAMYQNWRRFAQLVCKQLSIYSNGQYLNSTTPHRLNQLVVMGSGGETVSGAMYAHETIKYEIVFMLLGVDAMCRLWTDDWFWRKFISLR